MAFGTKLRALRRRESLTQAQFAKRLGISTSYLNLIENDRRPLTAQVLIKLAQAFDVDLAEFSEDAEDALVQDLREAFGDPFFEEHGLTNSDLRELASGQPELGRAVVRLYQAWRNGQETTAQLAARLSDSQDVEAPSRLPSEEVTDFIQHHHNHFPALEEAAERIWKDGAFEIRSLEYRLRQFLQGELGVRVQVVNGDDLGAVRRYDPDTRTLSLSENLPPRSRNFQLAVQTALLWRWTDLSDKVERFRFHSADARRLAKVTLANYFAGATLMPYTRFKRAAVDLRYDVELLGNRFRCSFEQVAHRLTTLRRPGDEGVPFHFIRVDLAGNISKRFSASGIGFARFGSACSKWNVFSALLTPGRVSRQVSRMPDGETYFCIARTLTKGRGGFNAPHPVQAIGLGCSLEHAKKLVYSDGIDLTSPAHIVPIGTSCRLCPRKDCEQRAFPSLEHPLAIDEHVRGASFFSPGG